ncbi:MAG TPA: phage integrase family protein [Firmicutes bacterium]|nr:phage integrase family protein [Candidatus Fermentithermobacillaceae bacterium]
MALAFRTMLAAGLRVSEGARLVPEDVILDRGSVFLRVRHGKGDKERPAPVTDAAVAKELVEYAGDVSEEYPGETILFYVTVGTLKVYAHRLKKLTGVDFHSHRMRHTLATRLLAQGTPVDSVQKVLGHADISTTRRYTDTMPEALSRVTAKLQETRRAVQVADERR